MFHIYMSCTINFGIARQVTTKHIDYITPAAAKCKAHPEL
jgi:hypothetical protein